MKQTEKSQEVDYIRIFAFPISTVAWKFVKSGVHLLGCSSQMQVWTHIHILVGGHTLCILPAVSFSFSSWLLIN